MNRNAEVINCEKLLAVVVICLLLTSCGTLRFNRTKEFVSLDRNSQVLNQQYSGYSEIGKKNSYLVNILHLFNVKEKCNSVTLEFKADKVSISYWTYNDSITQWKEQTFSGRWKKKYFEIYFEKKVFMISLLFSRVNIDRVRIGKDHEGRLVIMHFTNQSGNFLFLGAGYVTEDPYLFKESAKINGLLPVYLNGGWGFQDAQNNIRIKPQYDYAYPFRNGAAIVIANKKYGLIDEQGKPLTELRYDSIEYLYTAKPAPVYNVLLHGKYGVLDTLANIKIPPVYDSIGNRWSDKFFVVKNGKFGYVINDSIAIPPVYDSKFWFVYAADPFAFKKTPLMAQVKRNGLVYFVDESGYEYDAKPQKELFNTIRYIPQKNSKRKIIVNEIPVFR